MSVPDSNKESSRFLLLYLVPAILWVLISGILLPFLFPGTTALIVTSVLNGLLIMVITTVFVHRSLVHNSLPREKTGGTPDGDIDRENGWLQLQASLKEAQHIAHMGNWERNLVTDTLSWSDEVYNILETDPGTPASLELFLNFLSPEERDKIHYAYSTSLKNKTPFNTVHRLTFPDGRIKYVQEHCRNFYDDEGHPIRSIGTLQDITERWQTEESFRLLSRAVEQSPVSVVITDLKGNIVYVNPKFSDLTGYNYEEAVDQNPRMLKSGQTKPETYRKLWNTILSGREWSGEICNRKKDGTLYWEMAYISPVMNPNGDTTHFVAVKEDITERKRTEAMLHDLSLVDELTGLSNRRGFMLLAKQQIKVANRTHKGLILVYADLDRLKWINDTLGHKEGDRAIVDAAAILRKSFRTSDIVARLGGDEFVALSLEAQEHAEKPILARLRENLEGHNRGTKASYNIAISFGIAHYDPRHPCNIEELLERGDKLMYEEKQKSRQQQRSKDPSLHPF